MQLEQLLAKQGQGQYNGGELSNLQKHTALTTAAEPYSERTLFEYWKANGSFERVNLEESVRTFSACTAK